MFRPGIVGMRGSLVIRLRPCMIMSTRPRLPSSPSCWGCSAMPSVSDAFDPLAGRLPFLSPLWAFLHWRLRSLAGGRGVGVGFEKPRHRSMFCFEEPVFPHIFSIFRYIYGPSGWRLRAVMIYIYICVYCSLEGQSVKAQNLGGREGWRIA